MDNENWLDGLPQTEGLYKMKSDSGIVEQVEVRDLAIDDKPDRPRNFHVIHINGEDPDDPEYYSLNTFSDYHEYSWLRIGELPES